MDETSLRGQLERAISAEPPLGNLVGNSLRAGRRIRRRRRTGAAALGAAVVTAVAVTVTVAVPTGTSGTHHKVSEPQRPQPPPVVQPPVEARTAYVPVGTDTVVPISLATNTAGPPIKVPVGSPGALSISAAATPDGRTVYEVGLVAGGEAVTPIDAVTKKAGPAIIYHGDVETIAIDPTGETAYLSGSAGVVPIRVATNVAGKNSNLAPENLRIPAFSSRTVAFTRDGKRMYVLNPGGNGDPASNQAPNLVPIRTATNTALPPITLPAHLGGQPFDVALTPTGKTAYVIYDVQPGPPYSNSVIPIDLATNTALAPIALPAPGAASGLVIAPDGGTVYVESAGGVTPIKTATNQAEAPIDLPKSAGYAYSIAMTPDGKMIYVLTPRGVVPIRTASRTVLPMIKIPNQSNALAISPNGRTIYVDTFTGVVPISTATNTAGRLINVGGTPGDIAFGR
jgi:hypothetical protein